MPRRLFDKVIKGTTGTRPTRFHTQEGQRAPYAAYLGLPIALGQWVRLKLTGRRAERPWIPPSATRDIGSRLSSAARGLEIGAGMSTLWLAPRCGSLVTIEADEAWVKSLRNILAERGWGHVDLRALWRAEEMCDFADIPDGSLDFCLIDGGPRAACLRAALPKLKPDGWAYVDNTDLYPDAKALLLTLEAQNRGSLVFHRGFAPACLFVNEGAIIKLSPRP